MGGIPKAHKDRDRHFTRNERRVAFWLSGDLIDRMDVWAKEREISRKDMVIVAVENCLSDAAKKEIERLRRENAVLRRQRDEAMAQRTSTGSDRLRQELGRQIRRLLQLCHPDKHGVEAKRQLRQRRG